MSRDVHRDSMKNLNRSNSNDDIHLRPIATLIHSKPTSHGAGEMSFGARDDGSSMSSSNEYVAPSPYQNTSSAIAVSFLPCLISFPTAVLSSLQILDLFSFTSVWALVSFANL
jgi:hypothetical protein